MLRLVFLTFFILVFPAQAEFKSIHGWGVLHWEQGVKAASEALKKANIPFEKKLMHKDGTTVFILKRENWEGTVYFDEKGRMTQILFQSPYFKHESEAQASIKKVEDQFGPADEVRNQPYHDSLRRDTFYLWKNSSTLLILTKAHYLQKKQWVVWENYEPQENSSGR